MDLEYLLQLHALSSLKPVELVVELRILSAQPSDHINESSVLLHNVLVLILVAYGGGLLSLHQHLHAVLQITFLSLVLLLDVLVDDGAFYFLVLHKVIQLLVDGLLQLLMVVDVLHDPVDGVFLLVDLVGVLADDGAELGDLIGHRFLLDAQVVNLETGLSIRLIEVLQVVVEVVGLGVTVIKAAPVVVVLARRHHVHCLPASACGGRRAACMRVWEGGREGGRG